MNLVVIPYHFNVVYGYMHPSSRREGRVRTGISERTKQEVLSAAATGRTHAFDGRPRYQTSKRLTDGWPGTQILSLFERFDAPDDRKANFALASVLQAWVSGDTSNEGSEPPVLLENRIEVLQPAISLLEK